MHNRFNEIYEKPNQDVRNALRAKNKKLYQLAEAIGIADATLSRWLRHELPTEWKEKMFDAIEKM